MTLLSLQNISKVYNSNIGNFEVFKEINLQIDENENVFLFGPSGCGKSSLLNIISGLDKPDGGEISFLNNKISNNHHNFLKNDIGIIFQDHYLISELNIFENIQLKTNNISAINEIFDYFRLDDLKNKYPSQLSNGQKQRVCVARALVNRPKLLVADEPTSYLDRENADLVIDLIIQSSKKYKVSSIVASHDISFKKKFDNSYTIQEKNLIKC
ncbi:MAG: ATP-binding cassette domain-containing protein [Alphaproteobacteria bacterium]|jgi:ABC-type lipoprotein export system ATPase subunit